jgi:hypothetical protein
MIQRRDHRLELAPLVEHAAGPPQHFVDIALLLAVGMLLSGGEGKRAAGETQRLEDDLMDGSFVERTVRRRRRERAAVKPDLGLAAVTVDVQPAGLTGCRQQAEYIRQRK